jgi:hypothetical protein
VRPILALLRLGLPERQTHEYKRYGTITLLAVFNILNGKVIDTDQEFHHSRIHPLLKPSGTSVASVAAAGILLGY